MGVFNNIFYSYIVFNLLKRQFQNKTEKPDSFGLSFGGNIEVKQNIKGRLRIYSDFFKIESQVNNLVVQLSKIDSIQNISFNIKTGSLLVIYDADVLEPNLLITAIVRLAGFEDNDNLSACGAIKKEIQLAHRSVNYAVFDKSKGLVEINTVLALILIALAIGEYSKTKTLGIPQPMTLLYWAYDMLGLKG